MEPLWKDDSRYSKRFVFLGNMRNKKKKVSVILLIFELQLNQL